MNSIRSRRSFIGVIGALGLTACGAMSPMTPVMSLADKIVALMREALAALTGKRYDEALSKFAEVIKLDGKHVPAYVGMARSFIGKSDWGGAINSARSAFQIVPSGQDVIPVFAESLFGGGVDALRGGRFKDAIGNLSEYIRIQPGNANAYMNVGKAFIGDRQYGQALDAFVKGLGLTGEPGAPERGEFVRSIFDGGTQAFQQADYKSAIGFFTEYIKSDRSNVQAYLNLARSYWNTGDRGAALNAFGDVLKLSPTNSEALRFMLQR